MNDLEGIHVRTIMRWPCRGKTIQKENTQNYS